MAIHFAADVSILVFLRRATGNSRPPLFRCDSLSWLGKRRFCEASLTQPATDRMSEARHTHPARRMQEKRHRVAEGPKAVPVTSSARGVRRYRLIAGRSIDPGPVEDFLALRQAFSKRSSVLCSCCHTSANRFGFDRIIAFPSKWRRDGGREPPVQPVAFSAVNRARRGKVWQGLLTLFPCEAIFKLISPYPFEELEAI